MAKTNKDDQDFAYQVGKDIANIEQKIKELETNGGGKIITQKVTVDLSNIAQNLMDNEEHKRVLLSNIDVTLDDKLAGKYGFYYGVANSSGFVRLSKKMTLSVTGGGDVNFVALELQETAAQEVIAQVSPSAIAQVTEIILKEYLNKKLLEKAGEISNKFAELSYGYANRADAEIAKEYLLNGTTGDDYMDSVMTDLKSSHPDDYNRLAAEFTQAKTEAEALIAKYRAGEITIDRLV